MAKSGVLPMPMDEDADIEMSTPAPRPAISIGLKKWLLLIMAVTAVVICIVLITSVASGPEQQSRKETQVVSRSEIPVTALKLEIPAHDRREFLPIAGMHPEVTGFGKFSSHAVREEDGTECTVGEPDCVNGPVWKKYYVINESEVQNTYTVKFK